MKNLILCCLALVCLGCGSKWPEQRMKSRTPNEIENIILQDSYFVFNNEVMKIPQYCKEEFSNTRIISFDSLEETSSYCSEDKNSQTYGCYFLDNGLAGYKGSPTIVYYSGHKKYEIIIFHEFVHWAENCISGPDIRTKPHSNKAFWNDFVNKDPLSGQYENIKGEIK